MKFVERLIICCLLISCNPILYGQTIEETRKLAENQFSIGNYQQALFYYQRILCFGNPMQKSEVYIPLGDCYTALNKVDEAIENYEFAVSNAENDSIRYEIRLKEAFLLIKDRQYYSALTILNDFGSPVSSYFEERKNLYMAISYFLVNDFDNSQTYFEKLLPLSKNGSVEELHKIFAENNKINKISIRKAKIMSMLVPGLGQLYVGDVKNAFNSFILVASLLSVTGLIGYYYGVIDAVVAILPWAFRYYAGGIKRVDNIAKQKINQKRQVVFEKLLHLLTDVTQTF